LTLQKAFRYTPSEFAIDQSLQISDFHHSTRRPNADEQGRTASRKAVDVRALKASTACAQIAQDLKSE
jgi:hypothetical protein